MMCLNGTTSGSSSAFGVSSDLDVGVGSIDSESQTALAEKYKPGDNPETGIAGCGCFLVILAFILVIVFAAYDANEYLIFFTFVAGCIVYFVTSISSYFLKKNGALKKDWEARVTLYETGWICHRCGNDWIP